MLLLKNRPEDELLALINSANPNLPSALQPGSLAYGHISELSDGTKRVRLPAVTMLGTEYDGYAQFDYRRIDLTQVFGDLVPHVTAIGQNTIHRLLPTLNKVLGTNFYPEDVYDANLDWLGAGEEINLNILARPDSLGYQGSFIVRYTRRRDPLADSIGVTDLDVLAHPIDVSVGKTSIAMRTFDLDFTDHMADLSYYSPGRRWRYQTRVINLMAEYGFANWPGSATGTVFSYRTVDLPGSNPRFNNVYVQQDINTAEYVGSAFFHYNPK